MNDSFLYLGEYPDFDQHDIDLVDSITDGCGDDGGGGGGGGEVCELKPEGDSCSDDAECCSNKCKGKPGSKTCK